MRIALVTGGVGGIGQATAKRFALDGLRVVVADIDAARAKAVAATLPGSGHVGISLDVRSEQSVVEVFTHVEQDVGPISVLAHFAGILGESGTAPHVPLARSTLADWEGVMGVNARGTYLCVREMARRREAQPVAHARIITVASSAAQTGTREAGAAYCASKGAVISLTKNAARALGALGITVNAIAPGATDTPMLEQVLGGRASSEKLAAIPLGRVGQPDELAAAASFLASEAASFVTGTTLDVNGGMHMH